jgi:hypothetical protein
MAKKTKLDKLRERKHKEKKKKTELVEFFSTKPDWFKYLMNLKVKTR